MKRNVFSCQSGQRRGDLRIIRDEVAVEISETEKSLKAGDISRGLPVFNSLNLGLIHKATLRCNDIGWKFNLVRVERALFQFDGQPIFLKSLKDQLHMTFVFGLVTGIYQKVIKIDD